MEEEIQDKSLEELEEGVPIESGSFTPEIPDTVELPVIDNPDDREYEEVEIEVEGGV